MSATRRKIEVHRLTISGLAEDSGYGGFIREVRRKVQNQGQVEWTHGDKVHALISARVQNHRLRLRFYTYKVGFRPDVIDTETHEISDSPYAETQAGVEYTHVLGGKINGRYLLLIEKIQGGLWPRQMESYLQWLVDEKYQPDDSENEEEAEERISISLEPDPSEEFMVRLDSLDRITKATVRTVRPNPGWRDLETELGIQSESSHSQKTDVTMMARRNQSLSKTAGIIRAIRDLFSRKRLDSAQIEGKRGGQSDVFSTEKLNKYRYVRLEVDENGQIIEGSIWERLTQMIESLHDEEQAQDDEPEE